MLKSICYVNNTRNLFIHSPMECWWTFGFFYICITNKPTMNICYKFLCGHMHSFPLGKICRNRMARFCGKCMLLRNLQNAFWKWLYHFTFTPAIDEHLTIPYSCPQLAVSLFSFSHSNRYMVVSSLWFSFSFPYWLMMLGPFTYLFTIHLVFSDDVPIQILWPLYKLGCWCSYFWVFLKNFFNVYSRYKSYIKYTIFKYFLSVHELS